MIEENLDVWFGSKNPEGAKSKSQPKGPWVNICKKKKGGGHPPCGRKDADKGAYPVCRAKSVAANMTQKEKDSACRRKRAKGDRGKPKSGQKPTRIKVKKEGILKSSFLLNESTLNKVVSEGLQYHIKYDQPIHQNIYRPGSDKYFELFRECRSIGYENFTNTYDRWVLKETDLGKMDIYEGEFVPLDFLMVEDVINEAEYRGRDVELNKPKRGGSKKFYVYVKDPKSGNVRKVSFGAKSGGQKLSVKIKDPEARSNFAKRHNCKDKKDKTKAGYWACRLPRYAKQLGLGNNMNTYW